MPQAESCRPRFRADPTRAPDFAKPSLRYASGLTKCKLPGSSFFDRLLQQPGELPDAAGHVRPRAKKTASDMRVLTSIAVSHNPQALASGKRRSAYGTLLCQIKP